MSHMQYRCALHLVVLTHHSSAREGKGAGGMELPQPSGKSASSSVDKLMYFSCSKLLAYISNNILS